MAIFTIKGYLLGKKMDLGRNGEGGSEGERGGSVEVEERWREDKAKRKRRWKRSFRRAEEKGTAKV